MVWRVRDVDGGWEQGERGVGFWGSGRGKLGVRWKGEDAASVDIVNGLNSYR